MTTAHAHDLENPYRDVLTYDPETGVVSYRDTGEQLPVRVNNNNPHTVVNRVKENLRPLVISLQTGKWPKRGDYRFIGEDVTDLRWVNFIPALTKGGRYCPHCRTIKAPEEFTKSRANKSGYGGYCLKCNAAKVAEYTSTPDRCSICGPAATGVCPSCLRGAKAFRNDPKALVKMARYLMDGGAL